MKNIIESVLVKHLGKYIDGLKNSLDIGLLDGEVTIQNVSLKSAFINEMNLPFTLKFSHIQKIHIDIPWTNLKEKNTIITIKGIYALFSINYEEDEDQINPGQILKGMMERIRLQMKKKWTDNANKDETFAEKNLIRIIDNSIININNIHIRFQSFKRNWDYSIGVIMDNINSYTVDDKQQKCFYSRSFSKKQSNKPFNKVVKFETFQIYLNDHEKVFITNQFQTKIPSYILKMMTFPFAQKQNESTPPHSSSFSSKKKSNQRIRDVYPYGLKNFVSISLQALGTQKFAEDLRYIVSLNIQISKIDVNLSNYQLSNLIYMIQHFYDFSLNLDKNGRKTFAFQENTKKIYRNIITKIAKDQKINNSEQKQVLEIISEIPTSILEDINDEVINDVRVQIQVKKINKVTNAEKSKQMMENLIIKKQKLQAMEGVDLFKQVSIQVKIDRIVMSLFNSEGYFSQFGLHAISVDCIMDLSRMIKVSCKFNKSIFKFHGKQITVDFYELSLPWLQLNVQIQKEQIKKMHLALQKKEYIFNQDILNELIDWISFIRIKPSLLNYMEQLLNYSIDITRVMMQFMFTKGRNVQMSLSMPIITIKLDITSKLKINFGQFFGQNSQKNDQYHLQYLQPIQIHSNQLQLLQIGMGTTISMIDKIEKQTTYQEVVVKVPKIQVRNVQEIIRLIYAFRKAGTFSVIKKFSQISLLDKNSDEELEGQFYLNKIKNKLNIKLSRTQLVFTPADQNINFPEQNISLIRTKIYKLTKNKRYFIVFKQEVDRLVNIVEATSFKAMETIFEKLKDYIHEISTSFQWNKYLIKPYKQNIETLQEIQDVTLTNDILMKLTVHCDKMSLQFSQNAYLNLQKTVCAIVYNQFNTEASVELKKVDLIVQKQKIIYDASFKGKYQYLQSMLIEFQVLKLGYQIKQHQTLSNLIAISSQYQILIYSLRAKNPKKYIEIEQDETRLSEIKIQNNRTDNLFKFLLQKKFIIETTNIFGSIIGYCNKLSYIKLQIQKYRNQSELHIIAELKGIVLLSMIELPLISFKYSSTEFQLLVDSINAEINLAILIYEVIKGEGSIILKQFIKAYRDKQIARLQSQKEQKIQNKDSNFRANLYKKDPILKIDYMRIQLLITGSLCIGFLCRDVQLEVGRLSWDGLMFLLNKQCVSINQNCAILKWTNHSLNFCMTNFKLKLNSKEVIFLFNQLYKIYRFLKSKNFDLIRLIDEQTKNPDHKGRVLQQVVKKINIRIEEFQVIYQSADKNPLISIRLKPICFTNEGHVNSINLSIWHLNRSLKLYQPVVEPFQLKIVEKKETNQIDLLFQHLYLVFTQQLAVDILEELKLLNQIKKQLQKDQSNELQHMDNLQAEDVKKGMFSEHFQQYVKPKFQRIIEHSFILKVKSFLGCKCLVEVTCGKKQQEVFEYKEWMIKQGQERIINIAQKTSYQYSYELIQRYQKINLKICLQNPYYSAKSISVSFLLYDKDNYYISPVVIFDENGWQINSHITVKVQYTLGVYLVAITGMYSIKNETKLPLHFRYSDIFSINKFILNFNELVHLSPWIVQSINFGIQEDDYCHLLRLKPPAQNEGEHPGFYQLSIQRDENTKVLVIIHKEQIVHQVRQIPKLNQLKVQREGEQIYQQLQQSGKQHDSQRKTQQVDKVNEKEESVEPHTFYFRIMPGLLVRNHLLFPIKVNDQIYQHDEPKEILFVYSSEDKQFVKISLGDGSIHEIYLPDIDQQVNVNLKLMDENYIVLYLQIRKNKHAQRILHIYSEVQLLMNIHNMHVPILKTNIYSYYFIMKKEVKNNDSDKIHPSPVLKDKFIFTTYHYLLSLEQKYISAKLHDCTSNQIILYHSDFDKDMKFKSQETGEDEFIFAVSYNTKIIELEHQMEGRKPDILQCNYTYIMPKYYLINRSEDSIVVEGSIIIKTGEKIALDRIKNIELNVRDQLQYRYAARNLDDFNYILFIRGKQEAQIQQKLDQNWIATTEKKQIAENYAQIHKKEDFHLENISEASQLSQSKPQQLEFIDLHEEKQEQLHLKNNKPQQNEAQSVGQNSQKIQNKDLQVNKNLPQQKQKKLDQDQKNESQVQQNQLDQQSESPFNKVKHIVKMEDILIFALSKRVCDYNTISYQVHEWHQWLTVHNKLTFPIILRVKITEEALGEVIIQSDKIGKIICGLSDLLEIVLLLKNQQVILGRYDLTQRLNHNIIPKNYQLGQIILKQYKLKLGRSLIIQSPKDKKDTNIYKALSSINFHVNKISISLVLHEEKERRELIRFNIIDPTFLFLHYKNGLYMCHLKFQRITGSYKRIPFLIIKDFQGYVEGFKGQFIERLQVQFKQTLHITITDDIIATIIGQIQIFQKYLPKSLLLQSQEIILQQQQTYHINSIGIKPIEIKLCLKKVITDMSQQKARLLSKLSLSMIEVEDAIINLSPIQINTPLKQKHINGITKMYTMEGFVGVASGLNILGNPSQFMSQFEAGRNRGGVIPVFRSVVAGINNSLSKIIGTIGNGFSELTFDRDFIRNRIRDRNTRAQSFGMGLKMGLKQLAFSFKSSITGLVTQPLDGHREEGGLGILKGTLFGITGLVTKPVTGLILALSKTIQGINSTITYLDYDNLITMDLIARPLYHKFKIVRPYTSEDELAYNILINWYDYTDAQLVGSYLLESEEGDSIIQLLIITCSELILIDLNDKDIILKLRMDELLATGKFLQGVVLYYQIGNGQENQEERVFNLSRDYSARQNLYWTLKSFIGLYAQKC